MAHERCYNIHFQSRKGFTLFEVLIYIALASILIGGISTLLYITLTSRVHNQTIAEVEQQGSLAMRTMTQAIRNAESITSPESGTASTLTLDVVAAADDPTIIDGQDGQLLITAGGSASVALTNNRVAVSDLAFTNVSQSGSPGAIRVSFTITYINRGGGRAYDYEKTFYDTASLRGL